MKQGTDKCVVDKGKPTEKTEDYTYPILESLDEVIAYENALSLLNAKIKTEARNAKAVEMKGGEPGIRALGGKAKAFITKGEYSAEEKALLIKMGLLEENA